MKSGASGYRNAWIAAVVVLLTACSGIPRQDRDQEQLDRYLRYAGPPVDHITYLGRYDRWTSLGQYQLVVWTGINDAYLITVRSPCENLQFVQHIGLTQTGSTVSSRLDSVLVKHWRCQISEIRPVDYLRMQQDLRKEHEEQKAEKARQGASSP
jgi:hypothetical protein